MTITIVNNTSHEAFFTISKGDLVIAHWVPLGGGGELELRTDMTGTITARTNFLNTEYTSDRVQLNENAAYVAQIDQDLENKSYALRLVETGSSSPPFMQLYKTCTPPVSFIIQVHGLFEQEITQARSFTTLNLRTGPGYTVQAVINGITLAPVAFDDDHTTITATTVQDNPVAGFYRLDIVESKADS